MRIGVVIPTRGDRPKLLAHALYLLARQTVAPDDLVVVDENMVPPADHVDITTRLQVGCQRLLDRGCTHLVWWEDDDWYSPFYLEWMLPRMGQADLFGIGATWYYGLVVLGRHLMDHEGRSSGHATMLSAKCARAIEWPKREPKTWDIELWQWANRELTLLAQTVPMEDPERPLVISIKQHHKGRTVVQAHGYRFYYRYNDDLSWLKRALGGDVVSFELYRRIHEENTRNRKPDDERIRA